MTTSGADFGEIRSALHARELHRIERMARRDLLSAPQWDYIIQSLERWSQGNRWCVGQDEPQADALGLMDALLRREALVALRADDDPAQAEQPLWIARVLRVDDARGPRYRRVLARAELTQPMLAWAQLLEEELAPAPWFDWRCAPLDALLGRMRTLITTREPTERVEEPMNTMLGLRLGQRLERHVEALLRGAHDAG